MTSSTVPANVKTTIDRETLAQAIKLCTEADIVPFIWGGHGKGKTAVVRRSAKSQYFGYCDFHGSQTLPGDLRGRQGIRGTRTIFLPLDEMPGWDDENPMVTMAELHAMEKRVTELRKELRMAKKKSAIRKELQAAKMLAKQSQARCERGYLFFDEANRAAPLSQQELFQVLTARCIGNWVLPDGWHMIAAGNQDDGRYSLREDNDAAKYDRYCHLFLGTNEATQREWYNYMLDKYGESAIRLIGYMQEDPTRLVGTVADDFSSIQVTPSERSAESVMAVERAFNPEKHSELARLAVIGGLIGDVNARGYLASVRLPITMATLYRDGVEAHYKTLVGLSRSHMTQLMWIAGRTAAAEQSLPPTQIEVLLDLCELVINKTTYADMAVGLLRRFIPDASAIAVISNPHQSVELVRCGTASPFIAAVAKREKLRTRLSQGVRPLMTGTA